LGCSGFDLKAGVTPDPLPGAIDVSGRPRKIQMELTDKAASSELFRRREEKKEKPEPFKP